MDQKYNVDKESDNNGVMSRSDTFASIVTLHQGRNIFEKCFQLDN